MDVSKDAAGGKAREASNLPVERLLGRHVQRAHVTMRGEHQLADYVWSLGLDECVEILAACTPSLPRLASHHEQCRVGKDEERGFEEVIRTWALYVLSGVEGG